MGSFTLTDGCLYEIPETDQTPKRTKPYTQMVVFDGLSVAGSENAFAVTDGELVHNPKYSKDSFVRGRLGPHLTTLPNLEEYPLLNEDITLTVYYATAPSADSHDYYITRTSMQDDEHRYIHYYDESDDTIKSASFPMEAQYSMAASNSDTVAVDDDTPIRTVTNQHTRVTDVILDNNFGDPQNKHLLTQL